MQPKTSKEVIKRQRSCQFLLSALLNQGPRISDLLLERLGSTLEEGDPEPSAHALQSALARSLNDNMVNTIADDEAMFRANAQLDELRGKRAGAARHVAHEVIRLRKLVDGQYRTPELKQLGLGTQTAKSPSFLLRQADRITTVFTGEELEALLGEPYLATQAPPREAAVALAERAEALRSVLVEIDETVRARDVAYASKSRHLAEHDLLYIYTARTFEAICRLAGEGILADRVRQSTRRRKAEEPEGAPSEGAETGSPSEVSEEGSQLETPATA